MIRLDTLAQIQLSELEHDLKNHLISKFEGLVAEYGLDGIDGIFSAIVLTECESDYTADKYLEFCEVMDFDGKKWIHTVWAATDGYSEDMYIPYTNENMTVIEGRCC